MELRIKKLFAKSGIAEIMRTCNNNIATFATQVKRSIDSKIDNEEAKILQECLTSLESTNRDERSNLDSIINEESNRLLNDLQRIPYEEAARASSHLASTQEQIQQKLNGELQRIVDEIKSEVWHVQAEYAAITHGDSDSSDTLSTLAALADMVGKVVVLIPHHPIAKIVAPIALAAK